MDRGCGAPPRPTNVERETELLDFGSLVQRNREGNNQTRVLDGFVQFSLINHPHPPP
jgi:hypothetical protein